MRARFWVVSFSVVFSAVAIAACNPNPPMAPVGVSDKAIVASDQSVDMDGGGDNSACAHNPSLLEGKPCAPEGANCGTSGDPHQFSNTLTCHGGQWERVEVAPMPPTKS